MYVIGKEEALRFARENCTKYKQTNIDDIENGFNSHYLLDKAKEIRDAFYVEGVTEIVDLYIFQRCCEGKDEHYWSFTCHQLGVKHLGSGTIASPYKPCHSATNFGLTLLFEDVASGGDTRYFKYDAEERPNFVGKANKKKVEEWFDYLARENEAKRRYIDDAKAKNWEFQRKVLAKYPDARMLVLENGWMSECEFSVGYVLITYEALEDGGFCRTSRVDILSLPSTEKLFE